MMKEKDIILGDYVFTRKRIGRGAFSNIYKGKNIHTLKKCAIKEISFDNIEKIRHNIKREFTLMKKLNHPNIIKLYDVYFDNEHKNIYLILDYYEKGDLSKFLNNKPLKETYAKKYMRQLSMGLEYLYNHKILHRDLKLQNILVTDDLNIVITDFGFARYFENDTIIQTLCGSPMYMAPEIMMNKKYNNKSDLWSVGVIFFELLTGSTPYKAKNMIDLIHKIKTKPIVLPDKISNVLSNECKDLLYKLLVKDANKRIEWNEFFNHAWFSVDELLINENKLLEISVSGNNMPNIDDFDMGKNQFLGSSSNLFIHKSIRRSFEIKETSIDKNKNNSNNSNNIREYENTDNNRNVNVNISNNSQDLFDMSLELNTNDNRENTNNENTMNENTDSDSFKSLSDSEDFNVIYEDEIPENNINIDSNQSKPINIDYGQSTVYISRDCLDRYHKEDIMFYRNNEYGIEDYNRNNYRNNYRYISDPTNEYNNRPSSLSDSIKKYLESSLNFIKESYNYISNTRTI